MDSAPFMDAYQELSQRFMRLVNDLSALRALSSLSFQQPDEALLLRSAIRVLMENHDLERCSIFLLEDEKLVCASGLDWQDLLAPAHDPRDGRKPMVFHLGQGIIGMAAETGRLQHCRDCQAESRFLPPEKQFAASTIGSLICVPVMLDSRILGVVNVSHPQPQFFSESHERLLQVFAGFLGQILANWRYHHQMEQEIRRRTGELEQALHEAEELKRRYHQLSIVDELTGLHNRRFFLSEAGTALALAVRHHHPFSVLMIDLDHFKLVNDNHGHAMGDRVLQISSTLLKALIRDGDILARFGGEEFVLALANTDEKGAWQMAERILESLRTLQLNANSQALHITASIGIATLDTDTAYQQDRLEQLLRQADQALYFGKTSGRNQSQSYSRLHQQT
jgi:diguanylate cyclase (GGDEF)-like protein